ncbi:dihydrofolate reductase [Enterococcus hermanniensis]|uniref:Dihydrofolate reductase n=1 Tax=Enterococcus hermanniensis TaxID=249189 RepID=A0A1L8TQR1_9ENTE|nr:dihydrofolate reductase [Enterococcus hermanniensis]OJG46627.1 dihydrofolate reductase [Enterococcus hermanniensis]
MLIAIWAQDNQALIGKNNRLPWHLPNDLQYFKTTTINHTLVMGRKTFEGMGGRPLPKRQTIVLTHDQKYQAENVLVLHSVAEVLDYSKKHDQITFIAGGSAIYQAFLPYCDKIYRTYINETFEGDAYFPTIDWKQWNLVDSQQGPKNEKNPYDYYYEKYTKKKAN